MQYPKSKLIPAAGVAPEHQTLLSTIGLLREVLIEDVNSALQLCLALGRFFAPKRSRAH